MNSYIRHLGLAALLTATTAAGAVAGLDGKYSTKTEVMSRGSDGTIGWTLTLSKDGSAKLEAVRGGRLRYDSRNIEDYGEAFRKLTGSDKITLTGSWNDEGDSEFSARFRSIKTSYGMDDVDANLGGTLRDTTLRIRDWDRDFFGEDPDFSFKKLRSNTHTGDALAAGAAIVALGAIISNNDHGSSRRGGSWNDRNVNSRYPGGVNSLDVQTGGSGRVELGDNDYSIEKIRLKLDYGNRASLTIWSEYGKTLLTGTWSQSSRSEVRLSLSGSLFGRSVNGAGSASLRSNREVSGVNLGGSSFSNSRGDRWNVTFSAARG